MSTKKLLQFILLSCLCCCFLGGAKAQQASYIPTSIGKDVNEGDRRISTPSSIENMFSNDVDEQSDLFTPKDEYQESTQAISIFVECVRPNNKGSFTAIFGYNNPNDVEIEIPVGSENKFNRGGQDRGQTTKFQPGRVGEAFTVDFDGNNLVWTVNGRTTTANKNANACKKPISIFVECVQKNNDGTYTAIFGYNNPNDFVVNIPVGADNRFNRGGQDQGQTTAFQPGRDGEAFEVVFDGNNLVWTLRTPSNGNRTSTANKDFKACPEPLKKVSIFVECVRPNNKGSFTAIFGYNNPNDVEIEIPVGSENKFNRGGQDRGQTTKFQPGRVGEAFTVDFDGNNLVWTVNGRTTTANKNANACKKPISIFVECVQKNNDGTYTAIFGYNNPNDFVVNIPVGADNRFNRGGQDQGQTTAFQPGRDGEAFEVVFDGNNLVWTLRTPSNGNRTSTANKDFKACPEPLKKVSIFVECIKNNNDGTFTALFGYNNPNNFVVNIPVGSENKFNRGGQDRGQTTSFQPGRDGAAFEVVFDGNNLVWTVNGRTTTANKNFKACPIKPICEANTVAYKACNAKSDQYSPNQADHSIALHDFYGNGSNGYLTFEDNAFLQYEKDCSSGIIYGFATFDNGQFANTRWEINVKYVPKNSKTAPKRELDAKAYLENGGPIDVSKWKLMLITSEGGEMRQVDNNGIPTGNTIKLTRRPKDGRYGLQIGRGASGKNINFGASSWFFWEFNGKKDTGDFNIDLKSICVDVDEDIDFYLVDAEKDKVLFEVTDGMNINVDDLGLKKYNFIVSFPGGTKSVKFSQSKPFSHSRTENTVPYAMFGGNKKDYNGRDANVGEYEVSAIAYSGRNRSGNLLDQNSVSFKFVNNAGNNPPPSPPSPTPPTNSIITCQLVNSVTNKVVLEIEEGMQINLDQYNMKKFNIVISTYPNGTESLELKLRGAVNQDKNENRKPFTIFGDYQGNYRGKDALVGNYTLKAKAYSQDNRRGNMLGEGEVNFSFVKGQSNPAPAPKPTPSPVPTAKVKYSLVDAKTNKVLFEIQEGMQIDLSQIGLQKYNIVASTMPNGTKSFKFNMSGLGMIQKRTEGAKPYALFGDNKGNFNGRDVKAGNYTLNGVAYSGSNRSGSVLADETIGFSFVNSANNSKVVNTLSGTGNTTKIIVAKSNKNLAINYSIYYGNQHKSGQASIPAGATSANINIAGLNIPQGATYYLMYQYPGEPQKTIRLVK